jgi:hypothetical protein
VTSRFGHSVRWRNSSDGGLLREETLVRRGALQSDRSAMAGKVTARAAASSVRPPGGTKIVLRGSVNGRAPVRACGGIFHVELNQAGLFSAGFPGRRHQQSMTVPPEDLKADWLDLPLLLMEQCFPRLG